jgi:hypothetical protein
VIGHEGDQRKNEEAVGKLGNSLVQWELESIERYREQERAINRPIRARVGDLAIARCWPYPDMYRACYVTRVDEDGQPTHLRDGAGIRYATNARERKDVTIMPEKCLIMPRERLNVSAREIAARHWESRFFGLDLQAIVDRIVEGCRKPEAETDPARYRQAVGA